MEPSINENGIKTIEITKDVTTDKAYMYGIDNFIVDEGVTTLGKGTFEDAVIKNLYIPKSLKTYIGAFCSNNGLKCVYYAGSEKNWNTLMNNNNGPYPFGKYGSYEVIKYFNYKY